MKNILGIFIFLMLIFNSNILVHTQESKIKGLYVYTYKKKILFFNVRRKLFDSGILLKNDSTYTRFIESDMTSYYSSGKILFKKDSIEFNSFISPENNNLLNVAEKHNPALNTKRLILLYQNATKINIIPLQPTVKIFLDTSYFYINKRIDTVIDLNNQELNRITIEAYKYLWWSDDCISFAPYVIKNENANELIITLPGPYNAQYYDFIQKENWFYNERILKRNRIVLKRVSERRAYRCK